MPTLSSFSLTKVRWRNGKGELESHRGHEDSVAVGKKFAMDTAVMSTEGWGSHRKCCRSGYESDIGAEAENIVSGIGVCIQKMVIYLKLMSHTIPSGDSPRFLSPGEAPR